MPLPFWLNLRLQNLLFVSFLTFYKYYNKNFLIFQISSFYKTFYKTPTIRTSIYRFKKNNMAKWKLLNSVFLILIKILKKINKRITFYDVGDYINQFTFSLKDIKSQEVARTQALSSPVVKLSFIFLLIVDTVGFEPNLPHCKWGAFPVMLPAHINRLLRTCGLSARHLFILGHVSSFNRVCSKPYRWWPQSYASV